MKELSIFEATVFTSPNPLTLICTEKEDGTTNIAPICFVSYLSFEPAMIGFATGKKSHTGERVRATGKAVITVPSENLAEIVMSCGSCSGSDTSKVEKFDIKLNELENNTIKIPQDTKLAFVVDLQQAIEVGDHYFHICNIEKIYGDNDKTSLYAWNGFGKVAPAIEKM